MNKAFLVLATTLLWGGCCGSGGSPMGSGDPPIGTIPFPCRNGAPSWAPPKGCPRIPDAVREWGFISGALREDQLSDRPLFCMINAFYRNGDLLTKPQIALRARFRFDGRPDFEIDDDAHNRQWAPVISHVTVAPGSKLWIRVQNVGIVMNDVAGEGTMTFAKAAPMSLTFPSGNGSVECKVVADADTNRLIAQWQKELELLLSKDPKKISDAARENWGRDGLQVEKIQNYIEGAAALSSWEDPKVQAYITRLAALETTWSSAVSASVASKVATLPAGGQEVAVKRDRAVFTVRLASHKCSTNRCQSEIEIELSPGSPATPTSALSELTYVQANGNSSTNVAQQQGMSEVGNAGGKPSEFLVGRKYRVQLQGSVASLAQSPVVMLRLDQPVTLFRLDGLPAQ